MKACLRCGRKPYTTVLGRPGVATCTECGDEYICHRCTVAFHDRSAHSRIRPVCIDPCWLAMQSVEALKRF